MSNFKSIGQGVRGLRPPEIGGFPLTLNVALTTVLRTNVLHCDTCVKLRLADSSSVIVSDTSTVHYILHSDTLQYRVTRLRERSDAGRCCCDTAVVQGGPAKVRPTYINCNLLVAFECVYKF